MALLPRFAIGAAQAGVDHRPMLWALLAALEHADLKAQLFMSQSRLLANDPAALITGQVTRHLDSWLMSPGICREVFAHGMRSADIGVVEGCFDEAPYQPEETAPQPLGGLLSPLCLWLNLPRLGVIDVARLGPCQLPPCPPHCDGLLLCGFSDNRELGHWETTLRALWQVPVIAALPRRANDLPAVRDLQSGRRPRAEDLDELRWALAGRLHVPQLLRLVEERPFPDSTPRLFNTPHHSRPLRVALAIDEAIHRYFPDVLDLLDIHGASVADFSPLRDEALPLGTELVMLGCGELEQHGPMLARNHCVHGAIFRHVAAGGRVYAEGAGLAWLCRHVQLADGRQLPMAGILPAVARENSQLQPVQPAEVTLNSDNWLGRRDTVVRGYLNPRWYIQSQPGLSACCVDPPHADHLLHHGQIVGGRMHVNFVAQPQLLHNLFEPAAAACRMAATR